jgi:hypothetical protein
VKRLIAISFLLIYATTAFGITIDFHYCQGRMVKSSLLNIEAKPDCCCKRDTSGTMSKGCCNDDIKVAKSENHNTVQSATAPDLPEHEIITHFLNYLVLADRAGRPTSHTIFLKPERDPEPVYLLCRVFRI